MDGGRNMSKYDKMIALNKKSSEEKGNTIYLFVCR